MDDKEFFTWIDDIRYEGHYRDGKKLGGGGCRWKKPIYNYK